MLELARIFSALAHAPGEPAALATLVRVEGSSYRRPGARLLLLGNGIRIGSISGGCLEDDVILRAQRVLTSGQSEIAVYDTTTENDLVWGVGLGCQGVVHIFIEPIPAIRPPWIKIVSENLRARRPTELEIIRDGPSPHCTRLAESSVGGAGPRHVQTPGRLGPPQRTNGGLSGPALPVYHETITAPPSLVIFGAGEDARPLARLAKEIGWHVTVADSRSSYATAARFPEADAVTVAPALQAIQSLTVDDSGYAVIMTHRYAEDLQLLRQLLPHPLAYLGLLGPHKRAERLLTQLGQEGFIPDAAMLARLHSPIGLDLGGNTPETVALAILAEMQCRLTGRTPIPLRERTAPIHG